MYGLQPMWTGLVQPVHVHVCVCVFVSSECDTHLNACVHLMSQQALLQVDG